MSGGGVAPQVDAEPASASQVTPFTEDDHGEGCDPGRRLEQLLRCGQGGRPHALEQFADLLDTRGVLGEQRFAAGAEVAEPAPRFIDGFG